MDRLELGVVQVAAVGRRPRRVRSDGDYDPVGVLRPITHLVTIDLPKTPSVQAHRKALPPSEVGGVLDRLDATTAPPNVKA